MKTREKVYIKCIGIDNKIHECEPHKNVCKCGVEGKSKKLNKKDFKKYSCYECTY